MISPQSVVIFGTGDFARVAEVYLRLDSDYEVVAFTVDEGHMGGINAVFGHRRTKIAAERLAARAASVGFQGLVVQQDSCRDWEVDLRGLDSPAQREDFRNEAQSVGLSVTFEPG